MTAVTAEHLIRIAARKIEPLFNKRGEISPMYHYVNGEGAHVVFVPPPWCTTKNQAVAFAKTIFAAEHAVAYVFISEAWVLMRPQAGESIDAVLDRHGGSLENVPGRVEQVMLMAEDADGMTYGIMPIHRPEGRRPYLGKLKINRPDGMEGRMVGLLPQQGTRQ